MNQLLTNKSLRKAQKKTLGEERYWELKKEFDKQKDKDILEKFRILNEAYDIGKKRGRYFGYKHIARDFDVSIETVKRILSLRRATKRNWELMVSGKISAYKLAQALSRKNTILQNEVVDVIIDNNLSTRQIHKLQTRNLQKLRESKRQLFLEDGYKQKENAFKMFKYNLDKINVFLNMDINHFSKNKYTEMFELVEKKISDMQLWLKHHKNKV